MTKYKKVEVEEEVNTFEEMPKSEVDKEIVAAMKEGQEKIIELERENARLMKEIERIRKGPETSPLGMGFIKELRQQDIPGVNRTCKCCTKRVPLDEMQTGPSEFCKECARM